MKWFVDLATRTKLFLSFGLMVVFLLIVITTAYYGLTALRQSQNELFQEDFLASVALVQLRSDQNRVRAQLLEMMMTKDRTKQLAFEKDIREKTKEVDAGLNLISASLKDRTQESKLFTDLVSLIADYRKTRDEQLSLIFAERISEAESLDTSVQSERYNRIRAIARELGDTYVERAKTRIAQAEEDAKTHSRTFAGIGVLILILCVAAAVFLSRIIAKPLQRLTSAAERIASGDLGVAIHASDRKDEIGDLTKAFASMVRYLQDMSEVSRRVAGGDLNVAVKPVSDSDVLGNAFVDMTGYLREMAAVSKQVAEGDLTVMVKPVSSKDLLRNAFAHMLANLRGIHQELCDGVNVLASSASEILASTTQIASGMSETATSVTETTATVEEIKQTALLSSNKSRSVSESAKKSTIVAEQGNSTVSRTMQGISHIKELMETVAESVVTLSEQTQAIGEITTVVADLAQQSNLLAVNAAIEASKAGEHGKGFAVVAQEIKSLAEQSKQATEQVRKILGDIQKATGKSVLAAEQVSKAVEEGVKQTAESGESISKLAGSIGEAAQAAEQIAVSSQQQLDGMEQVAMAMENIKQATLQNALGTKQAEQAAHTLNELGQKLKEMVAKFRV